MAGKSTFSKVEFNHYLNWCFFAFVAFLSIVFLHQAMVGIFSYLLGYETHVYFGKVDSLPHYNEYWNNIRVFILYAFPSLFIFGLCAFLLAIFHTNRTLSWWTCFRFWFIVFGMLFSTAQMSISIFAGFASRMNAIRGFSVVMLWFDLGLPAAIVLAVLSIGVNLALGFISSSTLIYIAPTNFMVRKGKRSMRNIVFYSFICPLLILSPFILFLAYPDGLLFCGIVFVMGCLWLPGLFYITTFSLLDRGAREKNIHAYSNFLLIGIMLATVIVIRIFFT